MARILFLTQVLPYPLDSGAKTRAYYVLRYLAQKHEITLVSFVRVEDPPEAIEHLRRICARVEGVPLHRSIARSAWAGIRGLLTNTPVLIARDNISEMREILRSLGPDFDVIHADQTSMAQYALYARHLFSAEGKSPRILLDAHNALYRILVQSAKEERNHFRRALLLREGRVMKHYEHLLVREFDSVVFVSAVDRANLNAPETAPVIPICVDPTEKLPVEIAPIQDSIVHIGTMFWPPNVQGVLWFARQVWPLVQRYLPQARLVVIGRRPPLEIQALANESIEILGYVADPTPYLSRAVAFIVPLHSGAGMRVKIPDAWCWGVPIVSTTLGAEGIQVRNGENILLADSPIEFAEAIVQLWQHPELRAHLRTEGLNSVHNEYNWRTVYPAWDDVYSRLGI